MELPPDILVLKAKRAAYDLIASSILEIIPVREWGFDEDKLQPPIVIKGKRTAVLRTLIEVPAKNNDQAWFFKTIINGNALLRIDNKDYAGIDDYHTYHPIPPGKHDVELLLDNTRLFGDHEPYLILYTSYLAKIQLPVFEAGIKALGIIDLAEKLDEQEKQSVINNLYKLIELGHTPTHTQMAAALITLWLGAPYMINKRIDIPDPVFDHLLAAGLYGSDILLGEHMVFEPEPVLQDMIKQINKELDDLLARVLGNKIKHRIYVAGHSHLDAAWLWDYVETRKKINRTFATAALMAREKGMKFIQSSSLYLEWLEEESPELYRRVVELVRDGKWVPVGGMLIEPDLWMLSGESLARQLVLGQKLFIERTGRPSLIGWLPDSFGYPSSLPQLLVKAGIKLLVIHKTMWNIINKPEHHAFIWKGVDGSEIPVFVIPTNYAEVLTPKHLLEYDEKSNVPIEIPLIMPYGYSDGGGGPTWEMMIYRDQLLGLNNKIKEINEDEVIKSYIEHRDKLPVVTGDLLLEIHKGTLTTNHLIKELVAEAEALLRSAEIAEALTRKKGLENLWKKLLLHTFHDVLPGTSIPETYQEARKDLEEVTGSAEAIIRRNIVEAGEGYTFYNDLPWTRPGLVIVKDKCIGGEKIEYCTPIGWGEYLVKTKPIRGIGATWSITGEPVNNGEAYLEVADTITMGNEYLELKLSPTGEILGLKDRKGTNYLNEPSNLLLVHLDRPPMFDAWELDPSGLMNGQPLEPLGKPNILSNSGGAACLEFSKKTGRSIVKMRICLFSGSQLVRIDVNLDWKDRLRYLKAWFEPDIWTDKAWFEIPYGAISRPTMPDDPRKYALLYEVPALRWMDLSDGEKGLAIISLHKHGYTVFGDKIGLTLHKAPVVPDPYSGIGKFRITYHLYPHRGNTWESMVPILGYELWSPVKILAGKPLLGEKIVSVEPEKHAVITGITVRGSRIYANIYNPFPMEREVLITGAYRVIGITDLLGNNLCETRDNKISLKGFEVKTLVLEKS